MLPILFAIALCPDFYAVMLAVLFPRMLSFVFPADVEAVGAHVFRFVADELVGDCLFGGMKGCDQLKALLARTQLANLLLIKFGFAMLDYVEDGVDLLEALEGKTDVGVETVRSAMSATTKEIADALDEVGKTRSADHPLSDAVTLLARRR